MAQSDHKTETRYRDNYTSEVESAALYHALADGEERPQIADIYRRLAQVEEAHADFWARRIRALGAVAPRARLGLRIRALIWAAKKFGAETVLPAMRVMERQGGVDYSTQPEGAAKIMHATEQSHARIIDAMASPRSGAGMEGGMLARLEGRHSAVGGNALRAAVLGANDGLVSNLSLVMGVAGAAFSHHVVLVTGLAGLVAGACSMAMGEWLSVQSARELYQKQIATEAEELAVSPEEEKEELILIYQAKGLTETEARALADRVLSDPATALDTLVREELGIDPKDLGGSARSAAAVSFLLFCAGAIVPVMPFLFVGGSTAVIASLVLSSLALCAIGGATSLFTMRSPAFSALRQLAIGLGAAAITYGIGHVLGVSVSG